MAKEGTIRITKEFTFEMAHALPHHKGACKNIHGHSYKLAVTIKGNPEKKTVSSSGMVMDFGDLKQIIKRLIIDPYDHALVLNKNSVTEAVKNLNELSAKLITTDYDPTCENLLLHFATLIKSELPDYVKLHHLQLRETATSYAEWYAEDNGG